MTAKTFLEYTFDDYDILVLALANDSSDDERVNPFGGVKSKTSLENESGRHDELALDLGRITSTTSHNL